MDQKIILIGIIEENEKRQILNLTKQLLLKSNYKFEYGHSSDDIVCYCNESKILIFFDLVYSKIDEYRINNFTFDILIHSYIENYNIEDIKSLLRKSKICIINSDKGDLNSLLSDLQDSIVITYGLNSKSTITISSCNVDENIDVNLCLQRDIVHLNNNKVEPFEFNIQLLSDDESLLYPILSSSTLNLLLGDSILNKKPFEDIILTI